MVNPYIFQGIDSIWGPHTIDRFATHYNRQLPRFNSRFWNPNSEAVDAFTCDWSGENNWLCPPVYLIPRVLRHAANSKAVCRSGHQHHIGLRCVLTVYIEQNLCTCGCTYHKVQTQLFLAGEGQTFSKQGSQTQLYQRSDWILSNLPGNSKLVSA